MAWVDDFVSLVAASFVLLAMTFVWGLWWTRRASVPSVPRVYVVLTGAALALVLTEASAVAGGFTG